jgi:hypothetical protein
VRAVQVGSAVAESGDATAALSRSLAAHTAGAAERAEQITDALRALGRQFLDREQDGAWIATSAHCAGTILPAAVALERQLRAILTAEAPGDVRQWAVALVRRSPRCRPTSVPGCWPTTISAGPPSPRSPRRTARSASARGGRLPARSTHG